MVLVGFEDTVCSILEVAARTDRWVVDVMGFLFSLTDSESTSTLESMPPFPASISFLTCSLKVVIRLVADIPLCDPVVLAICTTKSATMLPSLKQECDNRLYVLCAGLLF